jgi:hypothetical protein
MLERRMSILAHYRRYLAERPQTPTHRNRSFATSARPKRRLRPARPQTRPRFSLQAAAEALATILGVATTAPRQSHATQTKET